VRATVIAPRSLPTVDNERNDSTRLPLHGAAE
jgi:hypothetical protein